jgi:hypothetical protein
VALAWAAGAALAGAETNRVMAPLLVLWQRERRHCPCSSGDGGHVEALGGGEAAVAAGVGE